MSDRIDFNTDRLHEEANTIASLSQDLKDAQTALRNTIEQLRKDWKTAAGNEFFRKFDEDWVSKLDANIELLEQLVTALRYAADQYEPIATEYSNISLNG